jgi:Tfp pilus assembly pilus retraction ATPase PilT
MDISELLAFSVKNKASDLHLSAGLPPMIRVHGDVRRINLPPLEHKDVHAMIYDIMNDGQRKQYEEILECDFSFAIPGLARFRVNAFNQERGAAAVLRTIPSKILSLEELNAPKIFGALSSSSDRIFDGIVRSTAAAPRSWLKALTRKRARPGIANEKSHSRISSYCLRWPSFMMS